MNHSLLFLSLKVFSATGGIEKVSRLAGMALNEICREEGWDFALYSAYDSPEDLDERYLPHTAFRGFSGRRGLFALRAVQKAKHCSFVVLSHVNLLPVGLAIKKIYPGTKLVLLAHGIEVWQEFSSLRKLMLRACDRVLPVSEFTREKMLSLHGLDRTKMKVVNNCLDPFLPLPASDRKSKSLMDRYGLSNGDTILFTLTRLSSKERYKGYDEVIMALKALRSEMPGLRYLIAGQFDSLEKARLDRLIRQQRLEEKVILAGFVPDTELADHFGLADIYIMPSRKEGFGIVFIEALYYGLPVIAGNVDGSVDALANGELGFLVDPDRPQEIISAIKQALMETKSPAGQCKAKLLERFGFPAYKNELRNALSFSKANNGKVSGENKKQSQMKIAEWKH